MGVMKKLTARQREALEFIVNYVAEHGFPPSIREIGAALRISSLRGDSMIGDAMLPGDLVIIRPQRTVSDGSLAAVLIGDEATVKRVRFDGDRTMLVASNPSYQPIVIDRDDSRIIGKVIGLIRSY